MTDTRKRVLVVYGTRPELIKLAPVIFVLREAMDRFEVTVCSSAQHRDLLADLEQLFRIRPDHDLDLMRPEQGLNDLAARGLRELDALLREVDPAWTLVQGDTTTAMMTALAAFHLGKRVGHVEAGLRTGDLQAPFPEEANRRIIDVFADLLFAPTERSSQVLLDEGHEPERVLVTGNTVVDALHWISSRLPEEKLADEVLITVHRRESFGGPLHEILAAIHELASGNPETRWVLPVHPNPNVAGPVCERLGGLANVELPDPLPYDRLVARMRRCRFVLTDSGGIQEEAPTFGKPVLVLREKTERQEGVEAGVAKLVGRERGRIVTAAAELLEGGEVYEGMSRVVSPYGDGRAAGRIVRFLDGQQVATRAERS
jgi:UDP-N-acetylglucosamine 2-epimerase (non-hydrolysing)